MPRKTRVLRLSSKGQIIIPASLRRQLGLKKGQAMEVRRGDGRELIFAPVEEQNLDLEAMLAQASAITETPTPYLAKSNFIFYKPPDSYVR